MKRVIATILTAVVLLTTLALPSFAVTKADIIAECEKSPVYKYVKSAVENAATKVEITDEQAAQILPLVQQGVALLSEDNGPTHFSADGGVMYPDEVTNGVMDIIDEICKILGFTWKWVNAATIKGEQYHANDNVFVVYDQNGNIVFMYDGDYITDTSAATTVPTAAWVAIGSAAALTVAAGAAFIVARKKSVA